MICAGDLPTTWFLRIHSFSERFPIGGPAHSDFAVKRHPELPPHIASDENVTEAAPRYS